MGQGFQRKIDTIVDSIVSSEKENNPKIDEFDIATNIKKAIADLNDVGKLLVLEDLSIEAGSKPSTLLTIDGKISVQKLNEVVVSKIKEAEREGIELRTNQPLIKENNNIIANGIVTLVVIDKMIENYQELTNDERNNLLNKYSELTEEQQRKIDEEVDNRWNRIKKALTPEQQEELEALIKEQEDFKRCKRMMNRCQALLKISNRSKEDDEELLILIEELSRNGFKVTDDGGKVDPKKISDTKETLNKSEENNNELALTYMMLFTPRAERSPQQEKEYEKVYNQIRAKVRKGELTEEERKIIVDIRNTIANREKDKYNKAQKEDNEELIEKYVILKSKERTPEENKILNELRVKIQLRIERDESETKKFKKVDEEFFKQNNEIEFDKINDKISQLNIELLQRKFTSQEIKEAIQQYKKYFKTLDIDTIITMKSFDKDEFQETLIEEFQELEIGGNVGKIVEELAKISYDGNLKNIITDDKSREEFIQELDKQIESLEPEKEEKQPQEEVDMESVKSELTAIPKALVSIDASTQDIAEGMQGYKKLIDNLDTKEIEGKSNEDVLKILAGRVSEIALSGNANLILEMMTQIGFSGLKNSEMKISPILTTVKSEFVQMIDDVSKEEYIEKTRNEMLAKEPIRDVEAEPGMKYFMVDLRVATKERNDLTNQIVGKDEKQDNITGSSDSDATQGSTSSGKISLQNMMNTVQNVRMSEIQNVQDLMVSIVKENTEKVQKQDELVQDEEQDMV